MKVFYLTGLGLILVGFIVFAAWFHPATTEDAQNKQVREANSKHPILKPKSPVVRENDHEGDKQKNAQLADGEHNRDEDRRGYEHEEGEVLKFTAAELKQFAIEMKQAGPGQLSKTLSLAGEVVVAPDRLYHVVPRVPGVVRRVFKELGDPVTEGEVLATLFSRELAEAKADLVVAHSFLQLANTTLKRERALYNKKITAEREYLEAKQAQTKAAVELKAAKQHLIALGLSDQNVASVLRQNGDDLTRYELRAPANGIIIGKHAVHGEVLNTENFAFTIADLNTVWVNLTVYQMDLPLVHKKQSVLIATREGVAADDSESHGVIDWISPTLSESTRSATARVILDNNTGRWYPGLFVNAVVGIDETQAEVVIPRTALQTLEDQTVVFVQEADGFEPRPVRLGRRDEKNVEVIEGLHAGETYVSENAFTLKAQMSKSAFGDGHAH